MAKRNSLPGKPPQPYDWHPREVVQNFAEIDYGFVYNGRQHQKQLGPPIVVDRQGGWAVLLIPVFRDSGVASQASRLEWHLSRWRLSHGVWRRKVNMPLRAHQLEALAGSWWTGELAPYVGLDYDQMARMAGVRRKERVIPWWCQVNADLEDDEPGLDDYG